MTPMQQAIASTWTWHTGTWDSIEMREREGLMVLTLDEHRRTWAVYRLGRGMTILQKLGEPARSIALCGGLIMHVARARAMR